jgi:autotransporter-associated beta strand protein
LAVAVAAAFVATASGQTWSGAASGNWNNTSNWSSPPINNVDVSLTFGATNNPTMNQNLANPFSLGTMTFTAAAPAYVINGNTIDFSDGGSTFTGILAQNSSSQITFNAPISISSGSGLLDLNGTGTGIVTLSGVVSGGTIYNESAAPLFITNPGNSSAYLQAHAGTTTLTSPTAVAGFQVDSGAVVKLGFTSGNNAAAPAHITLNGGTLAVPAGTADYYVTSLYGSGTLDFTGSTDFWMHFTGATPYIDLSVVPGSFVWTGANQSRIQNDGTAALNVQLNPGTTLTEGISLANGTTGQPILFGGGGTVTLTSSNNSANLIVDSKATVQVQDLAYLGSGSLTLSDSVGLITSPATHGRLVYTGPTATLTKNITLSTGGGAIAVTQNGSNLTISGIISESGTSRELGISGAGTAASTAIVTLTGANTYTGPTTVFGGGILAVNSVTNVGTAGPLGAGGSLVLGLMGFGPGTFAYQGPTASTDHGITFSNSANDPGYIQIAPGTNLTVGGAVSGPLNKTGAGTLTLTNGTNTITTANVLAGTLAIGSPTAIGPMATVNLSAGTTFQNSFGPGDNSAFPLVALNLNGGTYADGAVANDFYVGKITSQSGGIVNLAGSTNVGLHLASATPSINVSDNATWTGGGTSHIQDDGLSVAQISIAPGVTLNNGIALTIGLSGLGFQITGGGTLNQTGAASAPLTISNGTLQLASAPLLQTPIPLTLDGGAFKYTGPTDSLNRPFSLTTNGGTVNVSSATSNLQLTGALTGTGLFAKEGPGTFALTNASGFTGTVLVDTGVLQLQGPLGGTSAVAVNAAGTLQYAVSQSTGRTFNLNYGTLSATAGTTVTLNGAAVNGGFLRGPGTQVVTGGTVLAGVTAQPDAVISQTGPGSFVNFTNSGAFSVAAGLAPPVLFNGFTNQGSGSITLGAGSQVNVSAFQTYGTLTLSAGPSSATPTQLTNAGTTPMFFNGGSRTFISIPSHAGSFDAGIDLAGQNAIVAGGLFVNNGYVVDSVGTGQKTVIADFGSLVKGAGFFQNSVQTVNGGKFQAGNSPGKASFGSFTFGPGGVSNYVFAIDDATGAAGPSPDADGHVSGWGLVKALQRPAGSATTPGDFAWTASPANKLTVALETLVNPTTVGTDIAGPMADFDPTRSYVWPAVQWTGTYGGPADAAALNASTAFDLSGFANPIAGTFGWSPDTADHTLSLTYTPSAVPEPGTLALTSLAAWGLVMLRRRRIEGAGNRPTAGPGCP